MSFLKLYYRYSTLSNIIVDLRKSGWPEIFPSSFLQKEKEENHGKRTKFSANLRLSNISPLRSLESENSSRPHADRH